ncbi:hypothetical protein, partial [Aphanizomenon sp. CS-733/32]|uniref:hypothetical protein n=1 Tax=Aphanizomenon sp. CS-733/32 TaxID=3021715 RepID=UPI00232E887D
MSNTSKTNQTIIANSSSVRYKKLLNMVIFNSNPFNYGRSQEERRRKKKEERRILFSSIPCPLPPAPCPL